MTAVARIALVIASSLLVPSAAVQTKVLQMKTPMLAGAPLQVSGTVFNDTTLVVRLVNLSGRDVKQVTMGVVLEDMAAVVSPVTRIGSVCDTAVPPDGFLVVRAINVGFDTAAEHFRSKGISEAGATIGVTSVRFGDGTEWTYPLTTRGHFEEQPDPAVKDAVRARVAQRFPEDKDMSWLNPNPTNVAVCRK